MSASDHDLLHQYARNGSQAAFATLVERHLNLVYSAARRQVRSPQLAEDVAQAVFVDLAAHAHRFDPGMPLVAWLHVVTRRTAIDLVRREARRQAREHQAAEIAEMKTTLPNWAAVEPLLDEAVESLDATDRTAILLRYFENKNLREVGAALGTSDDAAQKRVSRAVEQLRAFFFRRGVTVTAASLATDLSAHALQLAPAGLGATISTAAVSSSVAAVSAVQATQVATMTTLQKSLLGTALALTLGAGVFEARVAFNLGTELRNLRQRTDGVVADARGARLGYERTQRTLDDARAQLVSLNSSTSPDSIGDERLAATMRAWFERLARIKQTVAQHAELSVPEFALLDEQTWFSYAQDAKLETDDQVRQLFVSLRSVAENSVANKLGPALRTYVAAHDGQLPTQTAELAAHFDPPIDPALLRRYDMTRTGKLNDVPARERDRLILEQSPADPERDSVWRIGANGFSNENAAGYAVRLAQKEFSDAHNGTRATTPEDLLPLLKWPLSPAKVREQMGISK